MNNKVHNSLLVFAVAVFIVTVSMYVYMYIAVNAQTKRVVIAKDIQKVQKLDAKQIEELQKIFSHSEPARDKLYGLFIAKSDIVSFIESLESIGESTGAAVEITSINEEKGETVPRVSLLKAHLEAKGSWSQVSKVLVYLETMQKLVAVEEVRFNNNTQGENKSGSWSLSLDIIAKVLQ